MNTHTQDCSHIHLCTLCISGELKNLYPLGRHISISGPIKPFRCLIPSGEKLTISSLLLFSFSPAFSIYISLTPASIYHRMLPCRPIKAFSCQMFWQACLLLCTRRCTDVANCRQALLASLPNFPL